MTGRLLLDLGAVVNGVWTYKDPDQTRIAGIVRDAIQWDLTAFDAWLYGQAHWRNYPKRRQQLMGLRHELTLACQCADGKGESSVPDIPHYFCRIRRLVAQARNMPESLRQAMLAVAIPTPVKDSSKLDAKTLMRIQREYLDRVQSGEKYGAQTQLAQRYGVSVVTLRKALKLLGSR
ncbi:MAG: hypothetical protein IPG23_00515 [Burkholderiales bacterium]|nr:hypothetical protein [Burkholderiales bacterium]